MKYTRITKFEKAKDGEYGFYLVFEINDHISSLLEGMAKKLKLKYYGVSVIEFPPDDNLAEVTFQKYIDCKLTKNVIVVLYDCCSIGSAILVFDDSKEHFPMLISTHDSTGTSYDGLKMFYDEFDGLPTKQTIDLMHEGCDKDRQELLNIIDQSKKELDESRKSK